LTGSKIQGNVQKELLHNSCGVVKHEENMYTIKINQIISEKKMKKTIFFFVLTFAFCALTQSFAISPEVYQQIQFKIEHSGNQAVREAGEVLLKHGILKPDRHSARSFDTSARSTDCHVQFNQRFLSNILKQDMVDKKLPEDLLELNLTLQDSKIEVRGRLDGPAFINPKFSANLDIGYLAVNSFRIRISNIRLAGFKASLFHNMICRYIDEALKRAFPANCQTRIKKKSGGIIDIDVKVKPEGFVPGVSKFGYLSNAGIANARMFFSFSVPVQKIRRR
jgi:hypothetical protein